MTTHRFSAAEYYHLGELGLLSERTELLNGIIIDMEPIGPWHADIVQILAHMFELQAHEQFSVRVQSPIDLGPESQPQPDLVLCRVRRYRDRHPVVTDIYLVVEVADTTLDFDLADKRALYSAADIAEYWVIDVQGKKLVRFLRDGKEQPVTSTKISPAIFPDLNIDLAVLFG